MRPRLPPWRRVVRALAPPLLASALAIAGVEILLARVPGDALDTLPITEDQRAVLAASWGLDRPFEAQLLTRLSERLHGQLGESFTVRPGAQVSALLSQAAPASAARLLGALALALALAAGFAAASQRWPAAARAARALSLPPAFLAAFGAVEGINALTWEGMQAGWWERPAWFALPQAPHPALEALAIGIVALAAGNLGEMTTALEAKLRALREAPFVLAAPSRGVSPLLHLLPHLALEAALLGSARLAWMAGGLVVVERQLLLPGAGSLLWSACGLRDLPLIEGVVLCLCLGVGAARVGTELLVLAFDPRPERPL